MANDIITALSTAWGIGGIAIVRISGDGSAALVDKIFTSRKKFSEIPARFMALGTLHSAYGEVFDRVLAVRFEDGASYTAEESAEIHCHGGIAAANRCVEELCSLGARIAEPGEFTRRAFINGRIDLSQAEAILGIIRAKSDDALIASARTLQGDFTKKIHIFLQNITDLAAALEVDLDFPEDGQGFISYDESSARLDFLIEEGVSLTAKCKSGMYLREGVRAAIAGAPNVGKSSLLNVLLAEERAIVTPIAGTTRDSIEETFIYKGLPIRIIDTAGIRMSDDEIEMLGVRRSLNTIESSDVVLLVIDGSCHKLDISFDYRNCGKPVIIVINKSDLPQAISPEEINKNFSGLPIVFISAAEKTGIDKLKDAILDTILCGSSLTDCYGVTARQIECMNNTLSALTNAKTALTLKAASDAVLSSLEEARSALASLLGTDAGEELLDKVFGSFCVGK